MSFPGDSTRPDPARPDQAPLYPPSPATGSAPVAVMPEVSGSFSVRRMFVALFVVAIGHAAAVGGAFLAGRLTQPSAGGGYDDVAAVVSVLVLAELALAVAALVAVIVYLVKGRRDRAVGVALGWLVGPIAATVIALAQANSPY